LRTIPADRFPAVVAAAAQVFITHGNQRCQGKAALFAAAVRYADGHERAHRGARFMGPRSGHRALPVLNPPGTASPRCVSVSVYARQLRQANFIATMRDRIVQADVDLRLVALEMTDALLTAGDDRNPAWTDLAELRRAGVRIAFDNYGTGYASLQWLRQPMFDLVKTDKSYLTEPDHRARNLILVQVVAGLCRRFNLGRIVDGVEDSDSLHLAKAAGARYGQGFLYAPKLPLTEAATYRTRDIDRPGRRPP
jgi:EAL domain-containing protein (putative c-di-GMP-specific phosphodiesterase class I)